MTETPKQPPMMFDEQIILELNNSVLDALEKHSNVLRSVVVILDYRGDLNDTPNLQKAFIRSRTGGMSGITPAASLGCIHNTLMVLESLGTNMAQEAQSLGNDIVEASKELLALKQEIQNQRPQKEAQPEDAAEASPTVQH